MKTILITGATGLVGSASVDFFRDRNLNVITAGRKSTDIILDISKPEEIAQMKINKKVDVCIHLAAANEVLTNDNPYESLKVNVNGTKGILDFCVNNHVKHIIYISTMHVFGHLEGIINENSIPVPTSEYGLTHLMAENYINLYCEKGLIQSNIIRPSNLYIVPKDLENFNRWTLTPFAFCKEAIDMQCISIHSNGTQKRNFLSIDDLNEIIYLVIQSNINKKIIHACGLEDLTIKDLAKIVQQKMKKLYRKEVEITINGNDLTHYKNFIFTSEFCNDLYEPINSIEDFVEVFCEKYMNFKMEN